MSGANCQIIDIFRRLEEVTFTVKFAYLSGRAKKIISRKRKYILTKIYTTIIRTYWATKYESMSESNFG